MVVAVELTKMRTVPAFTLFEAVTEQVLPADAAVWQLMMTEPAVQADELDTLTEIKFHVCCVPV